METDNVVELLAEGVSALLKVIDEAENLFGNVPLVSRLKQHVFNPIREAELKLKGEWSSSDSSAENIEISLDSSVSTGDFASEDEKKVQPADAEEKKVIEYSGRRKVEQAPAVEEESDSGETIMEVDFDPNESSEESKSEEESAAEEEEEEEAKSTDDFHYNFSCLNIRIGRSQYIRNYYHQYLRQWQKANSFVSEIRSDFPDVDFDALLTFLNAKVNSRDELRQTVQKAFRVIEKFSPVQKKTKIISLKSILRKMIAIINNANKEAAEKEVPK